MSAAARWFPVTRGAEVIARHVVQAQLLGQELAIWRSDAGAVNVWENRCPHRGVRLSIGSNDGTELRCRYHGWRFAGGSGQCTFVPAHPGQKPASTMRPGTYAAVESHGLVWTSLEPQDAPPRLPALPATSFPLRSLHVAASAASLAAALSGGYRFAPDPARDPQAHRDAALAAQDDFMLSATLRAAGGALEVVFLIQPVAADQAVLHGLLGATPAPADRLAVLRHHNAQMSAVRAAAEAAARRSAS